MSRCGMTCPELHLRCHDLNFRGGRRLRCVPDLGAKAPQGAMKCLDFAPATVPDVGHVYKGCEEGGCT